MEVTISESVKSLRSLKIGSKGDVRIKLDSPDSFF